MSSRNFFPHLVLSLGSHFAELCLILTLYLTEKLTHPGEIVEMLAQ
jgi:hypothetical protein